MSFVCFNGNLVSADLPVIPASNRAFKYGDAVFETMRFENDRIVNGVLHFERLFRSLGLLQIASGKFSDEFFGEQIRSLIEKNDCGEMARVRLEVFRDGNDAGYVMEATPLEEEADTKGWSLVVHPFVRKSCDAYANLKSSNFLPYVMADIYRKEKNADECIVLNSEGNIADGSRTNLFLRIKDELYTPALHQGCVNGVMRRVVIEDFKKKGIVVNQTAVTVSMLENANGVFLTNSIIGLRQVSCFEDIEYKMDEVVKERKSFD